MICLKVKQAQLKENKMSNNIYKILDKLKSVAGLDTPATSTKAKETIYESVAPRGDIAEAINSLESKYNTFKESTEGKQFKDISIGGKFVNGGVACVKTGEDTAKVSDSGRVIYLKPTSKIEEGREHKDKDSFDTNGKVGDTYKTTKGTVTKTTNGVRHERSAGKEEKDSDYIDAMDRTDEGIMSSIKSAFGGKKKPVARTRSTPKPDFRTSPEPQGSRRRESEYGANNWLAGSVNEESGNEMDIVPEMWYVVTSQGIETGPYKSRAEAKQNCPDMSHSAMIGAEAIEVFADDDMNEAGELDNYFPNAMSDLAKLSGVKYDKKPEPPKGFSNDDEVLDHDLRADPSKPAYIKKVTEADDEHTYVCVHVKKGKTEVQADSSYGAAKKAAAKWGLKSTAGIDSYLTDKPINTASLSETGLNELSKNTLQNYADASKRDYNSMNVWAKDEGMGPYSERVKSDAEGGSSPHWSTKQQSKRVAGLKAAKARGATPGHKTGGSYVSNRDQLRSDSRGMFENTNNFNTPADRDENAIANRKRLQALRDKQEDERAERGNDDYNTPMTRKVAGRAYGGTAQQDDSEFTSTGDDKLKKGFVNQQDNSLGVKWKKTGMGGAIDPELDEATATNQTYTVVTRKARDGRERESTGTLAELLDNFGYTLEVGKSYEHERGNRKINMNPKNIEALVNNLNNAKSNAAANGAPDVYYSVGENKTAEPSAIAEDDNDGISIQAAALCPNHTILTAWGKQTVVGLDRMMSRVKTEDGYDEKLHNEIVDAIMNGEPLVKTDWGTKNRNGISDMIYRHNGFATYETDGEDSGLDDDNLEEVSKETLGSYLKKAVPDNNARNKAIDKSLDKDIRNIELPWVKKNTNKEASRNKGIDTAINKLSGATSKFDFPTREQPFREGVEFSDKIKNSQAKWKKEPMKLKESKMLNESLEDVLKRFPHEVKAFETGGDMDEDLYHALFDYYFTNGQMPYGIAKARSGDPMEWVCQELESELGLGESIVDVNQSNIPSPTNDMPVSRELDEIAALAGLARPVATAVATTVASNMLADDDSGADDLSGLSDAELIRMANQDGIEDMIVTDGEGGLVNRDEIINQLDSSFMGTNANPIEEEESEFFKNPLGTNNITLEEEGVEEADPRKRDIEYTNTPREKTAGVQAAIPSGTDQSRIKKQYRKEYPGDNHMAVKEDALWKSYQAMLNDVTTKK